MGAGQAGRQRVRTELAEYGACFDLWPHLDLFIFCYPNNNLVSHSRVGVMASSFLVGKLRLRVAEQPSGRV